MLFVLTSPTSDRKLAGGVAGVPRERRLNACVCPKWLSAKLMDCGSARVEIGTTTRTAVLVRIRLLETLPGANGFRAN